MKLLAALIVACSAVCGPASAQRLLACEDQALRAEVREYVNVYFAHRRSLTNHLTDPALYELTEVSDDVRQQFLVNMAEVPNHDEIQMCSSTGRFTSPFVMVGTYQGLIRVHVRVNTGNRDLISFFHRRPDLSYVIY